MNSEINIQFIVLVTLVILLISALIYGMMTAIFEKKIEAKYHQIYLNKVEDFTSKTEAKYHETYLSKVEDFTGKEILKMEKKVERQSLKSAEVQLQKWKIEQEAYIRQDAINRSYAVNLGKITEHLIPFHSRFMNQFNPKDARFIGNPIDLVVFDGYSDKEDVTIWLVEIKTGNSRLTVSQQRIKQAVLNGNIRWAEINPDK